MNDPYEILGVNRDATVEDIKRAYKNKARKLHPDHGGDANAFTELKEASIILLDEDKRLKFDETGYIDSKADNLTALAMESIANFFISSINAMESPAGFNIRMTDLDFIKGAKDYFNQQKGQVQINIDRIERQIIKFEKVIKRLKTKRKNDIIKTMLESHVETIRKLILENRKQIELLTTTLTILEDYEFEEDIKKIISPYRQANTSFWP